MSGTMQPMMKPMLTPQMAAAAKNLAALGSGRDNMLAHINPREAQILMQMGGKGNMNPRTGLPQFDDGGGGGGGGDAYNPGANDPTGAIAGGNNPVTPNNQFPTGQTWDTLNAAIPNSGGIAGLWQDPNSSQWYNSSGALPQIDPTQMANLSTWYENIGPVGQWNPFDTSFAGGGFIPTPGNPIFQTDPANAQDVVLSPYGDQIAQQQYSAEQTEAVNDKRNQGSGLLPFEIALAPLALAGGFAGAGALGLLGDAGAAAADAGAAAAVPEVAGDLSGFGAAAADYTAAPGFLFGADTAAAAAPEAALSDLGVTAGDLSGFGAAAADYTAAPGFTFGADTAAAAAPQASLADLGGTSALAGLGENPSLAELAAATPDDLVGEAAPAATDATTAGGDVWDLPAAADQSVSDPLSAGSTALNTGGGSDLATLDTTQFPSGFVEPPDPATGLSPGAVGGTGGATSTGGGFFDKLLATGEKELSDPFKLLGLGASGIGLINSLAKQNPATNPVSDASQLQGLATQTGQEGAALSNYLLTGTLPAGLQAGVDQATKAAIQGIKAKYAANGMGPNSTPEQQDINSYMASVPARVAQIGQQLLQSGQSLTSLSASTLNSLLSSNTALNNQTNAAIANLARALSGGGLAPANQNQATAQQTGNVG